MTHTETIERDGMTFRVEHVADNDHGAPWENEDGHGPVSDWTSCDKAPGELVLSSDRSSKRYYDFAEACRIALRDGWGPRNREPGMSKRQIAALAARDDYEYLRGWCNDEWSYIGVVVTLLDLEGNETDATDSVWGVDDNGSYASTLASDCVDNIISETRGHMSYGDAGVQYSSGSRSWIVSESAA